MPLVLGRKFVRRRSILVTLNFGGKLIGRGTILVALDFGR